MTRLLVLTLAGDRICGITGFIDNSILGRFGLPRTLPENGRVLPSAAQRGGRRPGRR